MIEGPITFDRFARWALAVGGVIAAFCNKLSQCGAAAFHSGMVICLLALSACEIHTVSYEGEGACHQHHNSYGDGDGGDSRCGVAYNTSYGEAVWHVHHLGDAVSA